MSYFWEVREIIDNDDVDWNSQNIFYGKISEDTLESISEENSTESFTLIDDGTPYSIDKIFDEFITGIKYPDDDENDEDYSEIIEWNEYVKDQRTYDRDDDDILDDAINFGEK